MTDEFLVIRLDGPGADTGSWIAADRTGALLGGTSHGPLSQAATAASGRQVVVLVPAAEVLRTSAEIPVKAGGKLLQALPFALEDQLAEDVDDLHFAAGARRDDGRIEVAVVRRDAMDRWQQQLRAAALIPDRIFAESDAIGLTPNTATLLLQEGGGVLATPEGELLATDRDGAQGLLQLWIAGREAVDGSASAPLHMVVYATPAALAGMEAVFDELRPRLESLELRLLADGPLPRLAAQIVTSPGVNLLQGAYAPRSSLLALWPAWRLAASLLLAVLVAALAVQFIEVRRLQAEARLLDANIDQAFHYVFPDAGPIQDPRAELSSRLRQLGDRGDASSREFLDNLALIAQAIGKGGQARIEAVSYRAGSMELRLRAPSVESLDRIQQAVAGSAGMKAQIQSANAAGAEVVGRMQITRAGT